MEENMIPSADPTRWGTWYPVPGEVSTGYTFKLVYVRAGMYCKRCEQKCRVPADYAVRVYSGKDEILWCITCWLTWAHINDALLYSSFTIIPDPIPSR